MTRSILFDTETTGLDPDRGDRIIEIAALELENDLRTGQEYHVLIDPERPIPPEATRIHGFTDDDVRGKPRFADIADDFLAFVGDSMMIAHNAQFDFRFINAELKRCGRALVDYQTRAIDTVMLARKKYPGMPASLDALCRRLDIDLSERGTHNALLDCRLLSDVYVELIGGRQRGLGFAGEAYSSQDSGPKKNRPVITGRTPRPMPMPDESTLARHTAFIESLIYPIWQREE